MRAVVDSSGVAVGTSANGLDSGGLTATAPVIYGNSNASNVPLVERRDWWWDTARGAVASSPSIAVDIGGQGMDACQWSPPIRTTQQLEGSFGFGHPVPGGCSGRGM